MVRYDTYNNTRIEKHEHDINNSNNRKKVIVTLITKVTIVMINMIAKLRKTIAITEKKKQQQE